MRRALFIAAFCVSCTAPLHWSNPSLDSATTDTCSVLAKQKQAELEAEAKKQGAVLDVIVHLFEQGCALRIKQGLEPAKVAGIAAARHEPVMGAEPCE